MARTLVDTTEIIAGQTHPQFADSKNRYLKEEIWPDFTQEHDQNGLHLNNLMTRPIVLSDTYSGSGAAQTITFANEFLSTCILWIWSEVDGELYLSTTSGQTKQATADATLTDAITAFTTTGFTLGTNEGVNKGAGTPTYYYTVIGIANNITAGDKSSPPSWIADGTACLGGIASTMANSVEDALDTKFLVEHTIDTGAHDPADFAALSKCETSTVLVTGANNQVVSLEDEDLDIAFLYIWTSAGPIAFKGENLALLQEYQTTALSSTGYVILDTGEFTIDGTKMTSLETVLNIPSNTTDGDTVIVDTSSYAHSTINPVNPGRNAVAHSTDQAATGATSLKFALNAFGISDLGTEFDIYGDFDLSFELYLAAGATNELQIFLFINQTTGAQISIEVDIVSTDHVIKVDLEDDDGNTLSITGSTVLDDSAFHAINLTRVSGLVDISVDAGSEGDGVLSGSITDVSQITLCGVGGIFNSYVEFWYMDDILFQIASRYFQPIIHRYLALGT